MFAFFAGLAAGLVHVLSGPDHLAAIAPLASAGDRSSWRTGLQWGVGHTAGVLLIAALLLLLRDQLPLDSISAYSERAVGVALMAVGAWGMWRAEKRATSAAHSHAGASLAMGALHGLAGSSHLFGVLPALAFATRLEAVVYLSGFGAGAIAAMSAFACGVGLLHFKNGRTSAALLYASSAIAIVIGGLWLVGP